MPSSPRSEGVAPPGPFHYPNFRAFFVARLGSALAQLMTIIVIGWQVYDIARDSMPIREAALVLGLIGLVQFLPVFFLTPVVGVVADRIDRRQVIRASLALQLGASLVLVWFTLEGGRSLLPFFVVAALLGIGRAFAHPTLSALAPNLVPAEILPTAIALNSIAGQVGIVVGPVVGGIAYDFWNPLGYILAALFFFLSLGAMMLVGRVPRPKSEDGSALRQVLNGVRYIRSNQVVAGAISLDLFAVVLSSERGMLPIFARDILAVGPAGLGILRAAPAVGAGLMALLFTFRPMARHVGKKMLWGVVVFSIAVIVFGVSRSYPISIAALVVLGGADMISVYVRQSLIQLHTPDAMRGRVSAVSSLCISASNELGETRAGFAAAFLGAVQATVLGGVLALGITGLWALLFPQLRDADRFTVPEEIAAMDRQEG